MPVTLKVANKIPDFETMRIDNFFGNDEHIIDLNQSVQTYNSKIIVKEFLL